MGKTKRKTVRGAGVSITIPTEPLAGAAKNTPIMAVLVQDEGVRILEYEAKEGQSIQVRVGGTIRAFMERVGPAPDGDMFLDADSGNDQPVHVEFEHVRAAGVRPARRPAAHGQSGHVPPMGHERAEVGELRNGVESMPVELRAGPVRLTVNPVMSRRWVMTARFPARIGRVEHKWQSTDSASTSGYSREVTDRLFHCLRKAARKD